MTPINNRTQVILQSRSQIVARVKRELLQEQQENVQVSRRFQRLTRRTGKITSDVQHAHKHTENIWKLYYSFITALMYSVIFCFSTFAVSSPDVHPLYTLYMPYLFTYLDSATHFRAYFWLDTNCILSASHNWCGLRMKFHHLAMLFFFSNRWKQFGTKWKSQLFSLKIHFSITWRGKTSYFKYFIFVSWEWRCKLEKQLASWLEKSYFHFKMMNRPALLT